MSPPAPKASLFLAAAGLVFTWVAGSHLLTGCDLFGTKEFSPRPAEIRAFAGDLTRGDTIAFRVTESLADAGAEGPGRVLARRQVRFALAPESLQPSDGWMALSFRIYADPAVDVLDEGLCYVRFASDGLSLRAPDSTSSGVGGPRYFPLKVSAGAAPFSADSLGLLSLPPAFVMGGTWTQALGVLTVGREVSDLDTLEYGGRLEEAWRVDEVAGDGSRVLARGAYWYGATGLLKGRQTWRLEERDADGALAGVRELRRELLRL